VKLVQSRCRYCSHVVHEYHGHWLHIGGEQLCHPYGGHPDVTAKATPSYDERGELLPPIRYTRIY
jgi:hypothetical protein